MPDAQAIGKKIWAIAEGFIPDGSTGPEPEMLSHETACLLNTGAETAKIEMMLYFPDRAPVGPYELDLPGQRTLHVRFNDLHDPEPVPRGTDYACVIKSDRPIIVQHTRLDSRQAENALMTTIAYAED